MTVEEEVQVMTKEEAIRVVKRIFKGHKRFISYCEVMIASTDNFIGIESTSIQNDNWSWEKLLRLSIQFGYYSDDGTGKKVYRDFGFKSITYRKGNTKYSPENTRIDKGNKTSDIHDFGIVTIAGSDTDEYRWNA